MNDIFDMDTSGLKKLEKFAKNSPKLFASATANVLTSLAFKTKELDIQEITSSMIVRNPSFVKSSIQVQKARGSHIESQIAEVYSIKRENFSGWEEQQGKSRPMRKTIQTSARGGNIRSRVKPKYRMRSNNTFQKPEQYPGRDKRSSFYAMLRIMGTRGGGQFLLSEDQPLKHGKLKKGLFAMMGHRILRLQTIDANASVRRNPWRERSINRLIRSNNAIDIWEKSLRHVIDQANLK